MIWVSGTSDRCYVCSQGYKLDIKTEICVKDYQNVEPLPKEQQVIDNAQSYGTINDNKYTLDIKEKIDHENGKQLYLKFFDVN